MNDMQERWQPVLGYEDRYEVSDQGRVRSLPFMQRYLLRNGAEAYRRTRERIVAAQRINSGYFLVHLHLDGTRRALLVHRLVAAAFCEGSGPGREVNHRDGCKENNSAPNLEWVSRTDNHLHAVSIGLRPGAVPVVDPRTGRRFDSIAQAARGAGKSHRTVRATFARAAR